MTWGSDCHQCGREDCSWVYGDYCEGRIKALSADRDRLLVKSERLQVDVEYQTNKAKNLEAKIDRLRKDNVRLRDRAENLVIAIGMGWDLDGVVAEMQAALAATDDLSGWVLIGREEYERWIKPLYECRTGSITIDAAQEGK